MMKNKGFLTVFIAACLVMCLIPFGCMIFARTDTTTENKRLKEFPSVTTKDGALNTDMLKDMGAYFEDHFAFRQQLVTADAEVQSNVFQVSNVDTVLKGQNGWLYYQATLDDYLGKTMSERAIRNVAHNLAVMQRYVESKGAKFLFAVAPNKNSLYGDNMPYYDQVKAGDVRNHDLLEPKLTEEKIHYLDLFTLFEEQDEILYLKRDSHWNNKGAMMVYNAMLDTLGKAHDDFSTAEVKRTKTEYGDLNKMLYPMTAEPEWNYYYTLPEAYEFKSKTKSVEDAWIETENPKAKGTLLMYRDSFGNTLIPILSEAFGKADYSKMMPYDLAADLDRCKPEYVIVEKVERNLIEFAEDPPVLPAREITLSVSPEEGETAATVTVEEPESNMTYWLFSGTVDPSAIKEDSEICLTLKTSAGEKTYEVFYTVKEDSDYGFAAYLPKAALTDDTVQAEVIVQNGKTANTVCSVPLSIPNAQ